MDFFTEQDRARRSTKFLIALFVLAVAAIILGIYLLLVVLLGYGNSTHPSEPIHLWNPEILLWTALGVGLVTGIGSLFKIASLSRGGGAAVALSLGGTPILRETTDPLERRLLNVVDEMAIASGVPVPQVFVLNHEHGINAFAAGTTTNNAVVAVTRGTLEQLSRDELQGVVAHEFSHIFNGDMRLNLRIIGLVHGILLLALAGWHLLRSGSYSRSRNSGGAVALGLGLVVIGYMGVFFGRLIKASVSRRREFLADASAVQFTRNPAGISGALKKIGGFEGTVNHPKAEEASHLFFAQGLRFSRLFATHPPLEQRIAKLEPAFAHYSEMQTAQPAAGSSSFASSAASAATMGFSAAQRIPLNAKAVINTVGNPTPDQTEFAHHAIDRLGEDIHRDINTPENVATVIYGLLAADMKGGEKALRDHLTDEAIIALSLAHARWFRESDRALWLPVVELALPTLQELPPKQLDVVLGNVEKLVAADGRVSIFEFALSSVMHHTLRERHVSGEGKKSGIGHLREALALVLSLLAHAGHKDNEQARTAFDNAVATAPLNGIGQLLSRDQISLSRLDSALDRLLGGNFRFKQQVIESCIAAIATDATVTISEMELLRAIGARLDVPLPPLVPGKISTKQ
ncbi:MAG: M48 family metallopeptidase [Pseudomonadota bacterium]